VNRFNLSFKGEILPGYDPAEVRSRFAELFDVDNPARLDQFFSGETVVLRRNLGRKTAADIFHQLDRIGAKAELVKLNGKAVSAAEQAKVTQQGKQSPAKRTAAKEASKTRQRLKNQSEKRRKKVEAHDLDSAHKQAQARSLQALNSLENAQRSAAELLLSRRRKSKKKTTQTAVPNTYAIQPFRNTSDIRARATDSRQKSTKATRTAVFALLALVAVLVTRAIAPGAELVTGISHITGDGQGHLLLSSGQTLINHDRAGFGKESIDAKALGLQSFAAPFLYDPLGNLILRGKPLAEPDETADFRLLRCDMVERECQPFGPALANEGAMALAQHPRTKVIYLADPAADTLLKLSQQGDILAWKELPLRKAPAIRLHAGLLFVNSVHGPAISVLRPENSALGQQLDEIVLLPPAAVAAGYSKVGDFIRHANHWWVALYHPQERSGGVFRFDANWNYVSQLETDAAFYPDQLAIWKDKLLVRDAQQTQLLRFNATGNTEAPLRSDLLHTLSEQRQQAHGWLAFWWNLATACLLALLLTTVIVSLINHFRDLVYRNSQTRGALPVDHKTANVSWIKPALERADKLRKAAIIYAAAAVCIVVACLAVGASAAVIGAILLLLSGPAVAIYVLFHSATGHIGVLDNQVLVVDHTNMYHLGGGPRLQYRDHFVIVDDIVVFTGNRFIPAFNQAQLTAEVAPIAKTGIKVDRITVAIKLLQKHHPFAIAALSCTGTLLLAILTLLI
jgi:hypothetical protein